MQFHVYTSDPRLFFYLNKVLNLCNRAAGLRAVSELYGMMQLQRKVKVEKFLGGKNRHMKKGELPDEPIIVTNYPVGDKENGNK